MSKLIQRFINKRTMSILFVMLIFAFYLQLSQGRNSGSQSVIYEQEILQTKSGCDITKTSCPSYGEGMKVLLRLGDKPSGLTAFPVTVQIDGIIEKNIQNAYVTFTMEDMSMGKQQRKLSWNNETSQWQVMVILPICSTGRRDWRASVSVMDDSAIYTANYNFILQ